MKKPEGILDRPSVGSAGVSRDKFIELYEQYLPRVFRYMTYRVSDKCVAEDLTSEVFEKVIDKFSSYKPGKSSISTWLFTIARNTLIDHYRKAERKKTVPLENIVEMQETKSSPEEEYERQEEQQRLKVCLAALSVQEQEIVSLKFGSELNNRQIAGVMGLSETNIGTILYRSIRKLRDCFGGWQNG